MGKYKIKVIDCSRMSLSTVKYNLQLLETLGFKAINYNDDDRFIACMEQR